MDKEYIERNAALDALYDNEYTTLCPLDEVSSVIGVIPAADVVEVVRCKDCIHWLNEEGLDDQVCLKIYSDGAVSQFAWQHREPDDFCSYGKRRDSE